MQAHVQQRRDRTLMWRSFDHGRLILARASVGYFELRPGDRSRHVRLTDRGIVITDLGPCTLALLTICKRFCERNHQRIVGAVVV